MNQKEMTTISQWNLDMLLISSVRYAVGRHTYIVGWTADVVKQYLTTMADNTLYVIQRDVGEYLGHRVPMESEMLYDFDRQYWVELNDILIGELKRRGKDDWY